MSGYMYAITADNGNIKVGFTSFPEYRVRCVEREFKVKAVDVRWKEAEQRDEFQFHRDHRQLCLGREWYPASIESALSDFSRFTPKPTIKPCTALRNWRKERGLTLQNVADMLSVTRACVSRWENGQSVIGDSRSLAKVRKLTNLPVRELRADLFVGL